MIDDDVKITINLNKLVEAEQNSKLNMEITLVRYVRVSILMGMILIG